MPIRLYNNSGGFIDLDAGGTGSTANTFTLPAETGTVVLASATQTLTNKSIEATQLTGNVAATRLITALNATGAAPFYACRAWVNFDGTQSAANMIRSSGNVTSITDNGVGDYTVNFTTAMPDANYSVSTCNNGSASGGIPYHGVTSPTTGAVQVRSTNSSALVDSSIFCVAVFR